MITATEIMYKQAEAMKRLAAFGPKYMIVGRINYAMLAAHIQFEGRDRRRIKREINKAVRKAKAEARGVKRSSQEK